MTRSTCRSVYLRAGSERHYEAHALRERYSSNLIFKFGVIIS